MGIGVQPYGTTQAAERADVLNVCGFSDTGFDVPNDRQLIVDCAESPAGYVLFPADRPLTHSELVGCIRTF